MAYFNHAFSKMFLGTGEDLTAPGDPVTSLKGYVTTPDIPTVTISELGPGYFGFVNPSTWTTVGTVAPANCCPLVLVSSSVLERDKIGKFHGGYLETNKSKVINPRYIQRFYRVDPCIPQQCVISIGNTPGVTNAGQIPVYDNACDAQDAGFINANNFQSGTTCGQCCKEFICGETYYLRIDVKGSPALRALNHQAYYTVDAYTGCCPDQPDDPLIAPVPVDSTLVMIKWAEQILRTQYLNEFILPVVYAEDGTPLYAPGTTEDQFGVAVSSAQWWSNYVSPGHVSGLCAGLRLFGAYVDTRFLNCSFQVTDYFEKEPLRIFASEVDYTGDPCLFTGLCVYNDCNGIQGMGFGEQVVRDLIRSESYLQNFFHTDIRIREITQGNQFLNVIDRQAFYTRYYLLHSVPRFNNPTGTFDNDRYLLEIIIPEANPAAPTGNTTLENFMEDWLGNCPQCVQLEANTCGACDIVPDPIVL